MSKVVAVLMPASLFGLVCLLVVVSELPLMVALLIIALIMNFGVLTNGVSRINYKSWNRSIFASGIVAAAFCIWTLY
jgi:hypothetical protein